MTDRDLDTELDRVLARIEPHEPGAGLVARILADAPKPRRASLLDKVRAVLTPQGQRWPAGAALAAFGGIADAPSLRIMVASLWSGVLLISAIALVDPVRFWPVLVFQVIYKTLFILLWVLPIWLGRTEGVIPQGPTAVFVFIIALWPFFIVAAARSGQM